MTPVERIKPIFERRDQACQRRDRLERKENKRRMLDQPKNYATLQFASKVTDKSCA
jgi:hypothetical protein